MNSFFKFNIAGLQYNWGQAPIPFGNGTELKLIREPTNPHDHNAIAIYHGKTKLGHVPRDINRRIGAKATCTVIGVYNEKPTWERVKVIIANEDLSLRQQACNVIAESPEFEIPDSRPKVPRVRCKRNLPSRGK